MPDSRGRYARLHACKDLHEAGELVSEKHVGRSMRGDGLRAGAQKRFRSTTMSDHDQPVAADVLARQFAADRTNQRWVGEVHNSDHEILPDVPPTLAHSLRPRRPALSSRRRASSSVERLPLGVDADVRVVLQH
ncbi:MAG TPA: hypothetical protein VJN96_24950 [Vicinamibacterales bacterium]|nr:hypothetical protein [Vicinamibacterales bacterium]